MSMPQGYALRSLPEGGLHWEYDVPQSNKRMVSLYLIVGGITVLLLLLAFAFASRGIQEYFSLLVQFWWIFAMILGVYLLSWLLSLKIYHGKFHMIYELHPKGILILQGDSEAEKTQLLQVLMLAANAASRTPRRNRSAISAYGSNQFVYYSEIRSMKVRPEADLIFLKGPLTICDLYISASDIPAVRKELLLRCEKLQPGTDAR